MAVADSGEQASANGGGKAAPAKSSNSGGMAAKSLPRLALVLLAALLYGQLQAPPPKVPGTPGGPPVTSSRIELNDGRHLAYHESGVPREQARHKIIFMHGFDSCRYDSLPVSPALAQELGVYLLSFDRPGYGESDPHPGRTERSIALDIEQLADALELGRRFYVAGFSMGGEVMWSCLRYIPHRLSGVALLGPVGNFWWSGFPGDVYREAWDVQVAQDKWAVGVAHHAPWLTYWWNTQKMFPASSVIAFNPAIFSREDMAIIPKLANRPYAQQARQQGEYESLHRDMMVGFGKWSWSPLELEDPFPNGEGKVHLWHGADDLIVPVQLSRYISERLPWVRYHELPTAGHLFPLADGMADVIVKSLLLGDD
ncbi:hypothetical protein U9M48_023252 [Paspalum notatum var. saurae]|uniref:AB hydrolase-1 domain-containing protein n=1 Tax=Paspalum notatum var. saurae TaxID=547442 RepID=A0AAQ3TP49_PASNO